MRVGATYERAPAVVAGNACAAYMVTRRGPAAMIEILDALPETCKSQHTALRGAGPRQRASEWAVAGLS